jgi:predicted secreted protein
VVRRLGVLLTRTCGVFTRSGPATTTRCHQLHHKTSRKDMGTIRNRV